MAPIVTGKYITEFGQLMTLLNNPSATYTIARDDSTGTDYHISFATVLNGVTQNVIARLTPSSAGEWNVPAGASYLANQSVHYTDPNFTNSGVYLAPTAIAAGIAPPAAPWVLLSLDGKDGKSSIVTITATHPNIPAVGASATYSADSNAGLTQGQYVTFGTGVLTVASLSGTTGISLTNVDAVANTPVAVGAKLVPAGKPGTNGTNGVSSIATASPFTQPAVNANVTVTVNSSAGFVDKQPLFHALGGFYSVSGAPPSATTVVLKNLGYAGNIAAAGNVAAGTLVPSGLKGLDASSSGHTIQDESTALPQRTNLAFVGAGVTATDDLTGNRTVVTIAASGGGSVADPGIFAGPGIDYLFDTQLTYLTDGYITVNNTSLSAATEMFVAVLDINDNDYSNDLDAIDNTIYIQVQDVSDNKYATYAVTARTNPPGGDRRVYTVVWKFGNATTFSGAVKFRYQLAPSSGSSGGASGLKYKYQGATGTTATGEIRGDLAAGGAIAIHPTDDQGNVQSTLLAKIKIGATIRIQIDAANWAQFEVTGNYANGSVTVAAGMVKGLIAVGAIVFLSILSDAPSTIVGGTGRVTLTANRTYYVRPTGLRTGNLLTETEATQNTDADAFNSWKSAIDAYALLDQGVYAVKIKAGTLGVWDFGADGITVKRAIGSGSLILEGFDNSFATTFINNGNSNNLLKIISQTGGIIKIKDIKFDITNFENSLLFYDCSVELDNIYLKRVGSADQAIQFDGACKVRGLSGFTLEGSFAFPLNIGYNSTLNFYNISNCTIVGNPNFSIGFILGRLGAIADFALTSFSGAATGPRVNLDLGSHVRQNTNSVLPGSSNGTITSSCSLISA